MINSVRTAGRSLRSAFTHEAAKRRFASTDQPSLSQLLQQIENGSLSAKDAEKAMQGINVLGDKHPAGIETKSPNEVLSSFANLDHSRSSRTGFPEVSSS